MKRLYDFTVEEESVEEMLKAGRIMPYLRVTFQVTGNQYSVLIPAGIKDNIYIFKQGEEVFILARNSKHESIVFEIFTNGERTGGVYLRGEKLKEILGKRDLPATTIIKRLRSIFF